jgi:hypothetical protein
MTIAIMMKTVYEREAVEWVRTHLCECTKETDGRVGADSNCVACAGHKHSAAEEAIQGDSEQKAADTQEDEPFMSEYMQHLDEELNENSIEKLKGVDIDMNCVADLLRSVEEGSGQPGAAEGLIGMLGMRLPKASR